MNFDILKLNNFSFSKPILKNVSKVKFQGSSDIISFSDATKERFKIIDELVDTGFSEEEAFEMVKKYYKSKAYKALVNDKHGKDFGKTHIGNLEPAEAVVYLHFDLSNYYTQRSDFYYDESYSVGTPDFSPLKIARYMNEGFDAVLSGLILKGKIDSKTAKEVFEYYNQTCDRFLQSKTVKQAECSALKLSQKLDKLRYWTSDKKDENGNLLNGLTRPLTKNEAASIVLNNLRSDSKSLNNYIEMNKRFGKHLYFMEIFELWDVDPDDYEAMYMSADKTTTKHSLHNLYELIDCVAKSYPFLDHGFLEDIRMLDNNKFFNRYLAGAIKLDAMLCAKDDKALRQKNIQILNSVSDELLNKMSSGSIDEKGCFKSLANLFRKKDLQEKIEQLEEYRLNNPIIFNSMTKEAVMDFIINSDFYTAMKEMHERYEHSLQGIFPESDAKPADIVEFPNNQE